MTREASVPSAMTPLERTRLSVPLAVPPDAGSPGPPSAPLSRPSAGPPGPGNSPGQAESAWSLSCAG